MRAPYGPMRGSRTLAGPERLRDLEPTANLSLRSHRHEAEVHAISSALQKTGGNRKRAAKLLSISYRSLLYKIRQHNISPTAQAG